MSNKRWMPGSVVLAALLLAVSSFAQTGAEVTEEFHQTYPLAAGGRVSLSNINGDVRIVGWDRAEVRVDAVKRARSQQRLQEAQIKVDAGGNYVRIETEYAEMRRHSREQERGDNPASVEYTLSVPRGARLEAINLINGALDIEGLAGPVNGSSINGRVTARGLTGAVKLSVINGHLDATFDRLGESSISLSSVNGPLTLTIPSDSDALLRASTVHGQIRNDFNLPVRAGEYVGRNLEGRLGQGSTRVQLNNVNGAITIRRANDNRPLSPATNLLSETREGGVSVDVDVQVEAARATRELQRDINESVRAAQREAARAAREAQAVARSVERQARQDVVRERAGAGRDDARRQIARESNSFAVAGAPRVRIETFDGPVSVRAWDKPEVMYTAVKRASGEREMQGIRVEAQAGGGEVTIRAEFDKSHARDYVERGGQVVSFSSGASVELDVYVPREAALFVASGDGRLRVEGVGGELDLRTGDGPVEVSGARGRLRATTGDGGIRVEGFDGEAEVRTGDGRISLDGRFRSLAARTGDGTISLSLPEGVSASIETNAESVINDGVAVAEDAGEGRVRRWRVGAGGQLFTLRTGDGQVILRRR